MKLQDDLTGYVHLGTICHQERQHPPAQNTSFRPDSHIAGINFEFSRKVTAGHSVLSVVAPTENPYFVVATGCFVDFVRLKA